MFLVIKKKLQINKKKNKTLKLELQKNRLIAFWDWMDISLKRVKEILFVPIWMDNKMCLDMMNWCPGSIVKMVNGLFRIFK